MSPPSRINAANSPFLVPDTDQEFLVSMDAATITIRLDTNFNSAYTFITDGSVADALSTITINFEHTPPTTHDWIYKSADSNNNAPFSSPQLQVTGVKDGTRFNVFHNAGSQATSVVCSTSAQCTQYQWTPITLAGGTLTLDLAKVASNANVTMSANSSMILTTSDTNQPLAVYTLTFNIASGSPTLTLSTPAPGVITAVSTTTAGGNTTASKQEGGSVTLTMNDANQMQILMYGSTLIVTKV